MPWSEAVTPVRMRRVAVVVPQVALRETLVRIAEAGCVELDRAEEAAPGAATVRLQRLRGRGTTAGPESAAPAVLATAAPDLDLLEQRGSIALLAGEAQLEERAEGAVRRGEVAALAGWCPAAEVPRVAGRLTSAGGALLPLPSPRGTDPPTLLRPGRTVSFTPLVTTYGTPAYADLDPSWPAGLAYVAMFGIMFGDVGHGALLLLGALALRLRWPRRWARLGRLWPFLAGAGVASMLAGAAYGEFFGPTGLLPVLWLSPLEDPTRLLAAAVAIGAGLLALAHAAGAVNRVREGGWGTGLYAASGCAGLLFYLGLALAAAGLLLHLRAPAAAGVPLPWPGWRWWRRACSGPRRAAARDSPRRWCGCSTSSCAPAPTPCRSPGSRRSASPMPRSQAWCGMAPQPWQGVAPSESRAPPCCSSWARPSPSAWRPWWPVCRPCGWSSTNSSPGSSRRKADRSVPGTFPQRNLPTPLRR